MPRCHSTPSHEPSRSPYIFLFDSLIGSKIGTIDNLKAFLAMEARAKRQAPILQPARYMCAKVPKQPNHCDCGIFLLQYVETFFRDPEKYLHLLFVGGGGGGGGGVRCPVSGGVLAWMMVVAGVGATCLHMLTHAPTHAPHTPLIHSIPACQNGIQANSSWFKIKDTEEKRPKLMELMRHMEAEYNLAHPVKVDDDDDEERERAAEVAVPLDPDEDVVLST
jgi:Ulp1 family protease